MKKVPNKIREYIKDLNNKESFHILTTAMGFTPTEAGDILNVYLQHPTTGKREFMALGVITRVHVLKGIRNRRDSTCGRFRPIKID